MKEKKLKKKTYMWYLIMTVLLIVITLTVGVSVFSYYINHFTKEQDVNQYDKYYVMIAGDDSSLWQSVYEGAYDAGLQENSYVDLLDGVFDKSYSKEDLMRIAIASEVDGIIVATDESDEMTELINEAVEKEFRSLPYTVIIRIVPDVALWESVVMIWAGNMADKS